MADTVSITDFKAKVLKYLRRVQETGEPLIITDHGKPFVRIEPYTAGDETLRLLRGCVVRFDGPTEPVALEDWEALQ